MSVVTLEKEMSFVRNQADLRALLGTYGPASLNVIRETNLRRFAEVGLPNHKVEEFKYTPLRILEETEFKPAYSSTVYTEDLNDIDIAHLEGPVLAFVNGEYAPELSDLTGLPDGAIVSDLQRALDEREREVLQHLTRVATLEGRLGSTNDERFVWLNTAYLSEGAYIKLERDVVVERPIHLLFISRADHGPFAAFPRVLIVAEENSQAKIVESYVGLGGNYFNDSVTEMWLGTGSVVEHTRYQSESPDAVHVGAIYAHQKGASTWTSNTVTFGAKVSRLDTNLFVDGEHTESWLNGVYLGTGTQLLDNHTRIDHAVPNCHSFEVYKGILDDKATGVFNGKIFVYEDAQKTDAKQSNQALLLSPTATINTKPQLEIFADDVKCTHGATVGQLREDALFYLRSRGVPEEEARGLLVYGFAAEVLEKISDLAVREILEKALYAKLKSRVGLAEE